MKRAIKDKHLHRNQEKIEKVKKIIGAKTETEAIVKVLNFLIKIEIPAKLTPLV